MRFSARTATWVILSVLVALFVAPSGSVAGQRVVERVRYYQHEGYVRLVLDVDGPCKYQVIRHKNPDRIAINIRGSRAGRSLKNVTVGGGGIERVRINRLTWGTQVVVDLSGPATWKEFTLARTKSKRDRIVLDVSPRRSSSSNDVVASRIDTRRKETPPPSSNVFVVAVDAGHGGRDRGTKSGSLIEKRLTLDMARRVVDEINAHKGYKAVMTRDRDVYLDLPRRVEIAESKNADIFVSIHFNWAPNRSARGAEVFFISPAGARRTASRLLSDPNRVAHELGLRGNASSDVLHMLVDVNQQAVLQRSEALGEAIMRRFGGKGLPPRRGVKQKSFAVLRNITLPSILVECAFLSNRSDAGIVKRLEGRKRIAKAVADGVRAFLRTNPPPRERGRPVVVHRVRNGDTLWELSREYGSSIGSIRKLNRLGSSSMLRVGQELLIYGR